jgi:hypothetical protein
VLKRLKDFLETRRAHRVGRRDGKRGIPLRTERVLPFALQAIKERGDGALWAIAKEWAEEDAVLKGNYLSAKRRLEEAASSLRVAEEESARRQMERAQEIAVDKEESERLERLRRAKAERAAVSTVEIDKGPQNAVRAVAVNKEGVDIPSGGGSHPVQTGIPGVSPLNGAEGKATGRSNAMTIPSAKHRTGIGSFAYWSIILLIVLGEVPLNAFAFKLFGEADALSYLMTLSVALILIACAHALGIFLSREPTSGVERFLVLILTLVPMLTILGIAVVRNQYLTESRTESPLTPLQGTLAFALINLLIYAGAVVLSYLKHDPLTEHNLNKLARKSARDEKRLHKRFQKQAEEEEKRMRAQKEAQKKEEQLKREELERQREQEKREQQEDLAQLRGEQEKEKQDAERAEDQRWRQLEEPFRLREKRRVQDVKEETRNLETKGKSLSEAEDSFAHCRAVREKGWEASRARVMDRKNHYERLLLTYCAANVAAREDHLAPEVLSSLPEVEIPTVFSSTLDWLQPDDGVISEALLRGGSS